MPAPFVYTNSQLNFPKSDDTSGDVGAFSASNWNVTCQAAIDLRASIISGSYFGLVSSTLSPNVQFGLTGTNAIVWMSSSYFPQWSFTSSAGINTRQIVLAPTGTNVWSGWWNNVLVDEQGVVISGSATSVDTTLNVIYVTASVGIKSLDFEGTRNASFANLTASAGIKTSLDLEATRNLTVAGSAILTTVTASSGDIEVLNRTDFSLVDSATATMTPVIRFFHSTSAGVVPANNHGTGIAFYGVNSVGEIVQTGMIGATALVSSGTFESKIEFYRFRHSAGLFKVAEFNDEDVLKWGTQKPATIGGNINDSSTSVNCIIRTFDGYGTVGSKLLSIRNVATEKVYIDYSGNISTVASITGSVDLLVRNANATGNIITAGRLQTNSVAVTAANDLTLGTGNVQLVTGTTQINHIVNTGWQAGSIVTLVFGATAPTVKHGQATSGANIIILLAGAADFVATTSDVLTLVYDGTSWIEVSRSVN